MDQILPPLQAVLACCLSKFTAAQKPTALSQPLPIHPRTISATISELFPEAKASPFANHS
jgi:hypothetical protein